MARRKRGQFGGGEVDRRRGWCLEDFLYPEEPPGLEKWRQYSQQYCGAMY